MKQKLYIMRGIPGSGKSTFSEKMMKQNKKLKRLNKDIMRTMLNGDMLEFCRQSEDALNTICYQSAQHLLQAGFDVVIDNMNLRKEHIDKYLKVAADCECEVCIIDLIVPLEECLKRNSQRKQPIPEKDVVQLFKDFAISSKKGLCYGFPMEWEEGCIQHKEITVEEQQLMFRKTCKKPACFKKG